MNSSKLNINKEKTAFVVIDLQKGIASPERNLFPYSANEVVSNTKKLLDIFREIDLPVFLVHVKPSKETALRPDCDLPMNMKPSKDWAEFVPELEVSDSDVIVTKQQWGAFYGTDLDLQLRRRGIDTIILCGIATNIGVESTARFAYEFGYNQIFVEDAMATFSENDHNTSVNSIFKKMGKVRSTQEIIESFK